MKRIKISPTIKYAVIGVVILGVFVFLFKQTASAFMPKARGQQNIRLFRGRSNFKGTGVRTGKFQNLAGNPTQRRSQKRATRLMRRG